MPPKGGTRSSGPLGQSGFESNQVQLDSVQKHKGAVNKDEEWCPCNVRPVLARPCRRSLPVGAPPLLPQERFRRSEGSELDRSTDGQERNRDDRNDARGDGGERRRPVA